jgi:D-arabinose 1-dehydrogenase-like Zn-dependent alcohol dehydrogenase
MVDACLGCEPCRRFDEQYCANGRAVQVEPMKTMLKAPGTKALDTKI